jgi:hypothetical protein
VTDVVSGFSVFRLVTLRNAFRGTSGRLLTTQGWAANAELYARTARHARRVETISAVERRDLRQRDSRVNSWEPAINVWRSRSSLRHLLPPAPMGEAGPAREPQGQAEVASS